RAQTDATRTELEELRRAGDEQLRALRTQLEDARAQGAAGSADLARAQARHEADQDLLAELRGQREDLTAQREALRVEVLELRARLDSTPAQPGEDRTVEKR
ncbi:hypothetical protein ACWDS7_45430, partial [Streptosporangium sp. NPDC003464]